MDNIDYGKCFNPKCDKIMPMKYLIQIRIYDGHKHIGSFHHQLLCIGCKEKADEIYNHIDFKEK